MYHYAVVKQGQSIDTAYQGNVASFSVYKDMIDWISHHEGTGSSADVVEIIHRVLVSDLPQPIMTFVYLSSNPNVWVTTVYTETVFVWKSEE